MITDEIAFGRLQPQDLSAEEAVLGAVMTSRDAILTASVILGRYDFYREPHAQIFDACLSLYAKSEAIDLITVLKECRSLGYQVDATMLAEITNKVGSIAHLDTHCKIIKEHSVRRQVITQMSESIKDSFDDTKEPIEILNKVDILVTEIKESMMKGRRSSKVKIVESLVDRMKKGDSIGFNLTGIHEVDRIIGKVEPGELIIVGARPGMGKSMFANTIGRHLSIENDKKVLLWALEMTNEQNMRRMIANVGSVNYHDLKRGKIDFNEIELVIDRIVKSNFEFEDLSGVNAMDVRSRLITQKRIRGIDLAIIDHGGLLNNMNPKNTSEVSEISKTTKLLKQTAKDLHIPIVLLWQLSREVEKRAGSVPRLSDLRDSGSLEQDADKVIFLYRPDYYQIDPYYFENETYSSKGIAVMMCEKNREGELGKALMHFNPAHMRFDRFDNQIQEVKPVSNGAMPKATQSEVPF